MIAISVYRTGGCHSCNERNAEYAIDGGMGRSKASVSSVHVGAREWRPKTADDAFIASRHTHYRYGMACQIVAPRQKPFPS